MTAGDDAPRAFDSGATSVHVRRAAAGDSAALGWLISRLSPLLAAQARYRLRGPLSRLYDPDDVVQDVWARTLDRISDIRERDGRMTPPLLAFLSTTLLRHVNGLLRSHVRGKPVQIESASGDGAPWSKLPAPATDAVRRAEKDEEASLLRACISELDDADQEILVLRGVEQRGNHEAAELLGIADTTAAMRYRRALDRLRERVKASFLDELVA